MGMIRTLDELIDHAMLMQTRGDIAGAIGILDKVIEVYPHHRNARTQRGRLHFKAGNFAAGADDFEYFYLGALPSQKSLFVEDDGRPKRLHGEHVLLVNDSGLGDLLQFVRYGFLLKQRGARVTIECAPLFHALFRNCAWIDGTIAPQTFHFDHVAHGYTHRVPLHNLFGAFGTTVDTIPAFPSYLRASPAKLRVRCPTARSGNKLRIGVAWRSATESTAPSVWTLGRSIDLPRFVEAFDPGEHELVCLQKELSQEERAFIEEGGWIVLPDPPLGDLDDTAALMASLDLVVSTCMMTPHLSGALGVPTLLLLSTNACWRWMTHGTTSPWYPSMTLLRQRTFGDWSPVLEALRPAIATVLSHSIPSASAPPGVAIIPAGQSQSRSLPA